MLHTIVVGHPAKGRGQMPMLMIKCPNTGQAVPTGIETDAANFAILSDVPTQTKCGAALPGEEDVTASL